MGSLERDLHPENMGKSINHVDIIWNINYG